MTRLRDGSDTTDPRLDRIVQFDEASRQYPVRAAVTVEEPVTTLWTLPAGEPVLNQGAEGACVGFGCTNELRFNPVPVPRLDATFAREQVYWPAQREDPWNGGAYPGANPFYEGTSVLAGIKQLVRLGYVREYRWAFGERDLALGLSLGPAVIGVPWYAGMFKPDTRGYLNATGSVAGGHCVLVIGYNRRYEYYTIYNSWGPTWGDKGTARIRRAAMDRLLREDGDACIITARLTPATR